ncbi:MAG: transposase, partial [Candidatus Methanofastidiosia archaeon]
FGKEKARKIMEKLEFHYTPNHGSWLNMAEIEISVMERECLNKRRIPDRHTLHRETTAWKKRRNGRKARINWRFTREKARDRFKLQTYHN